MVECPSRSSVFGRKTFMQLEVRTARPDEWRAAARVLTTAFAEDPVIRWVSPGPGRDYALFRALIWARHYAQVDLALVDGEPVGCALWDPPGHRVPAWRRVLGTLRLAWVLRGHSLRGIRLDSYFEDAFPAEPFWYLANIGTVRQGQGVGGALLRHGLGRIEGLAYLECSRSSNVALYEHFGFDLTGHIELPDGPRPATMVRPAPVAS